MNPMYIFPVGVIIFMWWYLSRPWMPWWQRRSFAVMPPATIFPNRTLLVVWEEVGCGFSGSDTFLTYYISYGGNWVRVSWPASHLWLMFRFITCGHSRVVVW